LSEPASGAVRVFLDAAVQQIGENDWIGLCRESAQPGEILVLDIETIDLEEGNVRQRIPVCVIDSQPVIVEGDLRHRIQLHRGVLTPIQFEQRGRRV
jgi:hypothetical protein